MDDILLQAENLSYSYGQGNQVLKKINFTVKKGEKIAVLGSNGAGKSTCFLNLNGVLRPESGQIRYRGKEIGKKDLNELRKNVGIVFQDADSQIIASTVFAEVSFGPVNLKLPKEEVKRRVETALDCMNLMPMKDRPPHYLSGGEKKRVSIADIIAMESEVVIFDEPTASLDPVNVEMLEGVLDKMNEMGKTLLISTHDVDFAYRFADRAVIFAGGRIIADGPVREVFEDDEVLNQANLKRPILLEVYYSLVRHRILEEGGDSPRDAGELEMLLQTQRN
ncbi:energy-coupling factor ABC transporter ATP-binding protein [Lacrimispora sp.]|uniref:energy-coupling factor ABC transporter ATP-binding protein n=1 Tax=Lacrimispora sp. TaxID=2719234 RepID=UPI002898F1BE|nr:ABC transporter ATP-binding protein [Lacrimispora sp.]